MINYQPPIGIIGAGSVGKTLALAMLNKGYITNSTASRTFESAKSLARLVPGCVAYPELQSAADNAEIIFVTTSDDAIGQIASKIRWRKGQTVIHCSGAASLDVLEPVRQYGAVPGAFHPCQTFSSVSEAVESLPGSTFAIEGDGDTRATLEHLATELGGNPIFLRPEHKPLYHGTVVMAGGILNTLLGAIADSWEREFKIPRNDALKALTPITKGTAISLSSKGLPTAAAGPHVRGDVGTIKKHIQSISLQAPELLPAYCSMLLAGLGIAAEKEVAPEEKITEIREMLIEASDGRLP